MITEKNITYMRMAFEQAEKARLDDEVPIGAIVVDRQTGEILASGYNQTIKQSDPSAHAEMLAIRSACAVKQSQRLPDCDLYVTLEPCAMCASVISYARIKHLYFGAFDLKSGGIGQGPKIFDQTTIHHKPDITGGLLEEECRQIIRDFFKTKRDKNA